MLKDDLKCVLIGQDKSLYLDLASLVKKIDPSSRFKQINADEKAIINTFIKIQGPSLVFISDEVIFSLELLSDLMWQYNNDAIVVIVTKKAKTVSIKELFNNTQFSRINLNDSNAYSVLQFLVQSVREKSNFRRCKSLLGISEKRCQWLVDSSREAIAFISRDTHWYANSAYLKLFGISSLQKLRSITIKDIILSDEHLLFDGFQKNQVKASDKRRAIVISMNKLNGSSFRANVHLIPSVFKGKKCNQLWVQKINKLTDNKTSKSNETDPILNKIENSSYKNKSDNIENPFSSILKKSEENKDSLNSQNMKRTSRTIDTVDSKIKKQNLIKNNKLDKNTLLKGVVQRKDIRIVANPLKLLRANEFKNIKTTSHQIVSLKVPPSQKKAVDNLLMKLSDSFNEKKLRVFWNKVSLTKVLQILLRKKKLYNNFLLSIDKASINDSGFKKWLIPGLKRLGVKTHNITFLIPSAIKDNELKQTLTFIQELKKLKCQIVLDDFSINKNSLLLLKYAKPNFVKLSLPWIKKIEGSELKEISLSSTIRKFERNNIQVIAPSDFSENMKKLFILSGATFCTDSPINNAQ